MTVFKSLAFSLTLLTCAVATQAQTIGPGSKAPALAVKAWFKGKPVPKLESGKIYVVEFWATWCGPCIESIPHITSIAQKNTDVTFVGVSILEPNEGGAIQKFVDNMGDKMNYNVGWGGNQDGMSKTWFSAASQNGIPTAFIVKDQVIQWVGHPMRLEKPLQEIKANTFDLAAHKASFEKIAAENRRQIAKFDENKAIDALFADGKRAEAHRQLDAYLKKYPAETDSVEATKFRWLASEDAKAWHVQAAEYSESKSETKIARLLRYALLQAEPKGNRKLAEVALELALKGSDGKSATPYNYAATYFEKTEQWAKALAMVDEMVKLIPSQPESEQALWKSALAERRKTLTEKLKSGTE